MSQRSKTSKNAPDEPLTLLEQMPQRLADRFIASGITEVVGNNPRIRLN
jgi:hypothetical protein